LLNECVLGAIWYAAHGTFKTPTKTDSVSEKFPEINGVSNKLKNYLPLKVSDGEIKVVSTRA